MKSNKTPYLFGTVSHGTMREEDLIPAFLDAIGYFDSGLKTRLESELSEIEAIADEDEKADAMAYFLNETLFDTLNEFAPPYFYFGSHPGDGCDYGFWLSDDALQDFDGLRVSDTAEVPSDFTGEVLHTNDHGNATLYSAQDGKLTEIWSVV